MAAVPKPASAGTYTGPAATAAVPTAPTTSSAAFDVVHTYKKILESDDEITMPMAAIEALIAFLGATPSSTAMETVETVQAQARILMGAFPNPIPLKAGTDLFLQMLQRSLRGQAVVQGTGPGSKGATNANAAVPSFDETRARLVSSNRQFVAEAKRARDTLAQKGSRLVLDGSTVLTTGGSRAVARLLQHAAGRPNARFRVLFVLDGTKESEAAAGKLEAEIAARGNVTVERVPLLRAAHVLRYGGVRLVLVGSEVICGNGGLLSRTGTYQLALLANSLKKDFVVAAETHKIVRGYPLISLERFGITDENIDYTPPELISFIVTEDGQSKPAKIFDYILELYM